MNPEIDDQPIRVGIGLIRRGSRFLIRQRPEGQAMAGYWEFPGGKCEPGESPERATARECWEEVGIAVQVGEPFRSLVHGYAHGLVELNYFRCMLEKPEDEPIEGSGFRWVEVLDLADYRFPEANDAVIAALAREASG